VTAFVSDINKSMVKPNMLRDRISGYFSEDKKTENEKEGGNCVRKLCESLSPPKVGKRWARWKVRCKGQRLGLGFALGLLGNEAREVLVPAEVVGELGVERGPQEVALAHRYDLILASGALLGERGEHSALGG